MPAVADPVVVPPGLPPPTTGDAAAAPPPPPCGLLMIQAAILRDAATDLAGIELRMARAESDAWVVEHGVAAVDVLDRTIRLLQGQRLVLLDQLAEVLLSAHRAEASGGRAIDRLPANELTRGGT